MYDHYANRQTRYRDPDWLEEKYHGEGLSQSEIADICDTAQQTIGRWMDKFDIETRSFGNLPKDKLYKNQDWLEKKYYQEGKSQSEIGELCGVCQDTIHKWMWKFGLEPRSYGDVSRNKPFRNPDWLREKYHEQELTLGEMAEETDVKSGVTILRWMDYFAIPRRNPHELGRTRVNETGHNVASKWERELDLYLFKSGVDYEYEPETFQLSNRKYTPDFRIGDNIIEVKGHDWGKAKGRAQAFMNDFSDLRYIVIGIELPCDVHLPWPEYKQVLNYLV